MGKWMPQLDSAHQIGPETTLQSILIVVESGGTGGRINAAGIFHSQEFGPKFACTSTTSGPMDTWMLQAHLAHQTGLKPILYAVLILVESGGRGGRINAAGIFEIGLDFACTSTTGSRMDKWILQADSAHQIGPETSLQSILIVVESGGTGEELPRLCNSTLYLKSIPRLCNSTLQLNSISTSTLQLNSLQLNSLYLDSVPQLSATRLSAT